MGLFKKKTDPISDRSKALNAQIQALEAQIKGLHQKVEVTRAQPRVRSRTLPAGQQAKNSTNLATPTAPVFEPLNPVAPAEAPSTAGHFNDLGVKKYDLVAAWKRFRTHFQGPPASNPKLVSYLAAGSIKGLRPLRYEKRVARNRFIALSVFFLLVLWLILALLFTNR